MQRRDLYSIPSDAQGCLNKVILRRRAENAEDIKGQITSFTPALRIQTPVTNSDGNMIARPNANSESQLYGELVPQTKSRHSTPPSSATIPEQEVTTVDNNSSSASNGLQATQSPLNKTSATPFPNAGGFNEPETMVVSLPMVDAGATPVASTSTAPVSSAKFELSSTPSQEQSRSMIDAPSSGSSSSNYGTPEGEAPSVVSVPAGYIAAARHETAQYNLEPPPAYAAHAQVFQTPAFRANFERHFSKQPFAKRHKKQ